MNNQPNAFFFETEQIPENSLLFEELQKQELFFSYFQIDPNYYLFFYGQTSIDIDLIEPVITIIEELDRKQRKLQSLRGFFLYALETMENGKDLQILRTNLQPSFWRTLKTILRQNKKAVLLEFLFGSQKISSTTDADIEKKFKALENNLNSLQEKVIHLENQILAEKGSRNVLLDATRIPLKAGEPSEQYNPTLTSK